MLKEGQRLQLLQVSYLGLKLRLPPWCNFAAELMTHLQQYSITRRLQQCTADYEAPEVPTVALIIEINTG